MDTLRAAIREIPDFPVQGINFKDITPMLGDGELLRKACKDLIAKVGDRGITKVAGMEARGFIFGSIIAYELGVGFVPLRKPGKLPYETQSVSYALEYGTATLEVHKDAFGPNDKVLMVDDLLATGGTMVASCELAEALGATVAACAFIVELSFLPGRERLKGHDVVSLLCYDG